MPAVSKSQQAFFGLVDKLQKGEIPASKVTPNIRNAAKNTSRADVQDYLDTPTHDLPDKTMDKNENNFKQLEGGDPPAHSVSKPQQNFFKLVDLVKKGKVSPKKVTSNVRQAAKNTSSADVKKKVQSAPEKNESDITLEFQNNPLRFHEIVSKYNEYGRLLHKDRKLKELAQQLSDIAEYAEYALTNEADDWFDAHTIRRNIKEMRKYAQDFSKAAQEADMQHERLVAYYEDMGRILERYFEISSESDALPMHSPKSGPHFESKINKNAIALAESKLNDIDKAKFKKLPEHVRSKVAWRII